MTLAEPTHSRLSPSAASRWTVCTASVKFIEDNEALLPKDSSAYADEGTKAHGIAASILVNKLSDLDTQGDEMVEHARDYSRWVLDYYKPGMTLWVEKRLPLFYYSQQKGTVDACVWGGDYVFIGDLKYGAGVHVEAVNNKQLAIYAESAIRIMEELCPITDETPVILGIYQPRDRNDPEPIRLWKLTRAELHEFCQDIEQAALDVLKGEGLRFEANPDKQCRFCRAAGICKTYAAYGLQALTDDNSAVDVDVALSPEHTIELPDPASLTRQQRQKVISIEDGLTAWMKAIREQETAELLAGAEVIDFKLVAGRANRQWRDEAAAQKLLRNHLSADQTNPPSSLISPAQAEKLLKATGVELSTKFENRLAALIEKPEGKPTLVPVTDKRPALVFNPTDGLADVYEGL